MLGQVIMGHKCRVAFAPNGMGWVFSIFYAPCSLFGLIEYNGVPEEHCYIKTIPAWYMSVISVAWNR